MNPTEIIEKLQLTEKNGWHLEDLTQWNKRSFYTYMIENDQLCIAWIAMVNRINENKLIQHHFERWEENPSASPSMPRILIVTDGKKWFCSMIGSTAFKEMRFDAVLMKLYEELKRIYASESSLSYGMAYRNSLLNTMSEIKSSIRRNGEVKPRSKAVPDPFVGSGELIVDDTYKAMYDILKIRTDFLEKMLNMRERECYDQNAMLHYELFKRSNDQQLKIMLDIAGDKDKRVYVNCSHKAGEIILKTFTCDPYSNEFDKKEFAGVYMVVKENGELSAYEFEDSEGYKIIKPGFFKLNRKLMNELINKYKDEK